MEPILSKQEIADLLQAIKNGQVSTDIEDDGDLNNYAIECTPINLFQFSKKQSAEQRIPNFDIILDAYGQNYAISLTNLLQRTFNISRNSIEFSPFQEFLISKDDLGSIGVLNFSMLKSGALIIFDPALSFSLIEIMLGASVELDPLQLSRKLTTIELNVLKYVMSNCCGDLDRAFKPILEQESSLMKVENNQRLVSITEPESEVLVGSFTVNVGDTSGEMSMVFPLSTLEPVREPLKELLSVQTSSQNLWSDTLRQDAIELHTDVIAQSGLINLSVGEVAQLQPGDIIDLDYDPNSPLKVLVEGQLKFFAQPGTHNGKKAISLTGVYR